MDKFREECNNWNEVTELVDKLVQLADTSKEKEALELRDKIYEIFTKEYSEPLWNYLNLEEELGCPLEVVFKAIYSGIYYIYPNGNIFLERSFKLNHYSSGWCLIKPKLNFKLEDYKKTWWLKRDKSE